MLTDGFPLRALLFTVVGWASHEQQRTIDYLIEENRVPKEQLGNRRLRLTNYQRRLLAEKGEDLGRSILSIVATIMPPNSLLGWCRLLLVV